MPDDSMIKYTIEFNMPSCFDGGKTYKFNLEHVPCVHIDELSVFEIQAKTASLIVTPLDPGTAMIPPDLAYNGNIPQKYKKLFEVTPGGRIYAGKRGNWQILSGIGGQLFNIPFIGDKFLLMPPKDGEVSFVVGFEDPDDYVEPGDKCIAIRAGGKWVVTRLTPRKQKQKAQDCKAMVIGGNSLPDVIKLLQQNIAPNKSPQMPTSAKDEYGLPRSVYPNFPTYIFPKIRPFHRPIVVDWGLFEATEFDPKNPKLPRAPDGIGYGILLKDCSPTELAWYEGIEDQIASGGEFEAPSEENPRAGEYKRAAYFLEQNIPFAAIASGSSIDIYFLDAEQAGSFYSLDPYIKYEEDKIDENRQLSSTAKRLAKYAIYNSYFKITKDGRKIDEYAFRSEKTKMFVAIRSITYSSSEGKMSLNLATINMENGSASDFSIEKYLPCQISVGPIIWNSNSKKFSEAKELIINKRGSVPSGKFKVVYLWNATESVLSFKDKVIIDHNPIKYYDQKRDFRYVYKVISTTTAYKYNTLEI